MQLPWLEPPPVSRSTRSISGASTEMGSTGATVKKASIVEVVVVVGAVRRAEAASARGRGVG